MFFSHSGAMGDIIYHLPVIRELGGGDFRIIPADRDGFRSAEDFAYQSIAPLLDSVKFLSSIAWSDAPVGICFDGWRRQLNFSKNLTNQAASWLGMADISPSCDPWLSVHANRVAPVVISHSSRNYNPRFPWRNVLSKYEGRVVFVGRIYEHCWFCEQFGFVPHYETKNLLEVAEVIAGSKFFIGNPSAPLAIAEGLKHPCIAASFADVNACVFYHRPGQQHCWESVDLWEA